MSPATTELSTTEISSLLIDWHETAAMHSFTMLSGDKVEVFAALAMAREALTLEMKRYALDLYEQAGEREDEFIGEELAAAANWHPETGRSFLRSAVMEVRLPHLWEAMERGELTERHARVALDVLPPSLPDEVRGAVTREVLRRMRERAEQGKGWPTPGRFRQLLRRQLLIHDPMGAERREREAADRRELSYSGLPDGQATLSLTGPAAQVWAMVDAVKKRAADERDPQDSRSLEAQEYDAAFALLTQVNPKGGDRLVWGGEAQVVVPIAAAHGDDGQPGDLPGYGPLLPSTCRDLLGQADRVRRICVDAVTGAVLAVDDAVPGPGRLPAEEREASLTALLERFAREPVLWRDLSTDAYRPSRRLLRHIRARDQTCVFPGCTRVGRFTDADHREEWPVGRTDHRNLHCLCRRHHRAKQFLFDVTVDEDGDTLWRSRLTGKTYRRAQQRLLD